MGYLSKEYDASYYKDLIEQVCEYPNPNFNQVVLDLQRTFPTDPFFKSQDI
jgi:hypothetical protein